MKAKPYAYFLCAITLILIALSPVFILSYYETMPENESYKGILTLWHITGWRTGGSSGVSFLKKRASEFESVNPHVFIRTVSMTAAEANEAVSCGEIPDIVSYPYGYEISFPLSFLPQKDFAVNPLSTAYPYMRGGYCMLINTDMLSEQAAEVSEGWGLRPDELLTAAQFGLCFDSEKGYTSLPSVMLHEYPEAKRPNISTWGEGDVPDAALGLPVTSYTDGLTAFCEEKACILIASQRQLFEAQALYEQNEAPSFSAYAVSGYTDMAQMISAAESEDELKKKMCISFTEFLVSESAQKKLYALGVFPVLPDIKIYQDDECRYAIYELLCKKNRLLFPQYTNELDELSKKAYSGDAKALREIRRLLQ